LSDDEFIEALKRNDKRFEHYCGTARKLRYEGNQDGIDDMLDQVVWNHDLADKHGFDCVGDALLSFWEAD